MTKRLFIIGASGFGREILGWAKQIANAGADWTIGGFLDANPHAIAGFGLDVPVIGDPSTYEPQTNDVFTCAIGAPEVKLRICRQLQSRGGQFVDLIHPTAVVGPHCRMGTGTILCPFSSITTNVALGDFVTLNTYAAAGHDSVIGDGCTMNSHTAVNGNAKLGTGVMLGCHAAVNPGAKVGDFATVGAGSVVIRRVPPRTTVMGVPAKRIWSAGDGDAPVKKVG